MSNLKNEVDFICELHGGRGRIQLPETHIDKDLVRGHYKYGKEAEEEE